ncbi:radical SAM protein, partial [Vibrio splendidus]
MRFEGKVYRPWMEAESVLIQTTLGGSNNQCTFCTMFDDKRFKVRDIKDIFEDIDAARKIYPHVESIFLVDGNVMAIRTEMLISILDYIKITFPEIKNISLYSGFNDFRRKSLSELKEIKSAGLSMAYSGLESGDPIVLERIQKRMTREHAIEGMNLAREADIKVLASFIFGLGGKERSVEHAINTTSLLNIMQPDAVAPMALAVQPGSVLEKEVNRGEFVLPTPLQILEEEKYLLENLEDFDCYYWGDHGNNISPMRGMLPQAR